MTKNILCLIMGVALMLPSCREEKPQEATAAAATVSEQIVLSATQQKLAGITLGTVVRKKIATELKVNGVVDVPPQNIISVSFPLGGFLKSTKLLTGMHVSKGEVIATMEDQSLIQLQQDYLIALSRLHYLEQEYLRQQELHASKVNAAKVYQQALADYTSQKALVKGYQEKLRLIGLNPDQLTEDKISRSVAIVSPINGFVSKVNVNVGKYVSPTDILFELINPDDIHAALTVFEKDLNKVAIGQWVKVSFADDPSREYECKVILISRNVDENRSGLLHCHFEVRPRQLLPGMFLNARIRIWEAEAQTLPEDAVVRAGNDLFVVEATGAESFRLIKVKTGIREGGTVEVISDETLDGRKLVTGNAYAILSKKMNVAE